jgi:hypothetical protein
MIQTGLRSFVGNGSSLQDFVGAAKIILQSSSLETDEKDVSGSPSNFISALMVSQLSLNCPGWYLFFQQKIHKTCQPELFHHGAKAE